MFAPSPEDLAVAQRIGLMQPDKANQEIEKFLSMGGSLQKLLMAKRMLDTQKQRQGQSQVLTSAQRDGINTQPTTVAQDIASQLSGVAGLPTRDDMFTAAGGGIVAFQEGGQSEASAKYNAALSDSFPAQIGRMASSGLADIIGLPGQLGWDWDHYRRTGELKKKHETQGFFPVSSGLGEWESGIAAENAERIKRAQEAKTAAAPTAAGPMIRPPSTAVAGSEYGPGIASLMKREVPDTGAGGKRGAAAPVRGEATDAFTQREQELAAKEVEQEAAYRKALGNRPAGMTDKDAQALAKTQREEALKGAGIKSYQERIDALKEEAKTLDKDRDTDRWLALAQGFFAMGAGKSRYALQNMSEGLGVTTTQLREAEKEYRKAMQAKKTMESALEEAERKEVLGDVSAGREIKDKINRAQERFDEATLRMQERLLEKTGSERSRLAVERERSKDRQVQMAAVAASREGAAAARQEAERGRMMDRYNRAVQTEKANIIKMMGPTAFMDPSAESNAEQQAIRNVVQRNPSFAEMAGVDITQPPPMRATQRYNPQTGKLEPVK